MLPDQVLKALPPDALDFIRIQMISLVSRCVKREPKLAPPHNGIDGLIGIWRRIGRPSGAAESCMVLAAPGRRLMTRAGSRVRRRLIEYVD